MRLATWNIRHGLPGEGRPVDLRTVAGTLADLGADVVGLQEVDRHGRRSGGVDQAAELGRATGCAHHFAAARPLRAGGWYGNALLVRGTVLDVEDVPLPTVGEPRVLLLARVRPDAGRVPLLTVGVTHLQHGRGAPVREAPGQLAFVLDRLARADGPVALVGDLNLGPDEVAPAAGAAGFDAVATGPTFPARRPSHRVDWVLTRGLVHGPSGVAAAGASDHLPVVVELSAVNGSGTGPVAGS